MRRKSKTLHGRFSAINLTNIGRRRTVAKNEREQRSLDNIHNKLEYQLKRTLRKHFVDRIDTTSTLIQLHSDKQLNGSEGSAICQPMSQQFLSYLGSQCRKLGGLPRTLCDVAESGRLVRNRGLDGVTRYSNSGERYHFEPPSVHLIAKVEMKKMRSAENTLRRLRDMALKDYRQGTIDSIPTAYFGNLSSISADLQVASVATAPLPTKRKKGGKKRRGKSHGGPREHGPAVEQEQVLRVENIATPSVLNAMIRDYRNISRSPVPGRGPHAASVPVFHQPPLPLGARSASPGPVARRFSPSPVPAVAPSTAAAAPSAPFVRPRSQTPVKVKSSRSPWLPSNETIGESSVQIGVDSSMTFRSRSPDEMRKLIDIGPQMSSNLFNRRPLSKEVLSRYGRHLDSIEATLKRMNPNFVLPSRKEALDVLTKISRNPEMRTSLLKPLSALQIKYINIPKTSINQLLSLNNPQVTQTTRRPAGKIPDPTKASFPVG